MGGRDIPLEAGDWYCSPALSLDVEALVDKNAAVVRVRLEIPDDLGAMVAKYPMTEVWVVTGSSKRDKGDVSNPSLGRQLALARALEKLARELKRDASRQVQPA